MYIHKFRLASLYKHKVDIYIYRRNCMRTDNIYKISTYAARIRKYIMRSCSNYAIRFMMNKRMSLRLTVQQSLLCAVRSLKQLIRSQSLLGFEKSHGVVAARPHYKILVCTCNNNLHASLFLAICA